MDDLDFFYDYIKKFQERDIPKEELRSQYVRYWMIETMQEDIWIGNYGYITETDYVYVDGLKNIEPKETVYPSKIVHDEIMNRFNMKSWQVEPQEFNKIKIYNFIKQIGNYEAGKIIITVPELDDNCQRVINAMKEYGYIPIQDIVKIKDGYVWKYILFNPVAKFDCNKWMKSYCDIIYHMTRHSNNESIKTSGLVPKTFRNTNDKRLYYYCGNVRDRLYLKMMKVVLGENEIVDIMPVYVDKVINQKTFYYDPNFDHSVFTNEIISPDCIDWNNVKTCLLSDLLQNAL